MDNRKQMKPAITNEEKGLQILAQGQQLRIIIPPNKTKTKTKTKTIIIGRSQYIFLIIKNSQDFFKKDIIFFLDPSKNFILLNDLSFLLLL